MSATKVSTRCPKCDKPLRVDPQLMGKTVRCPGCQHRFVVSGVNFSLGGEGSPSKSIAALETHMGGASADTGAVGQSVASGPILARSQVGRFELREVLGRGGFGIVYRAYDPMLQREVALKVPLFSSADGKRAQRFLNEAKSAAKLRHPNIVAVYESGEANGTLYLAAEFVQGQTLAQALKESPPSVDQSVAWVKELAGALAYAHLQGIVHRDIKPQNVMIDRNGRPQIMDFGLAKRLDQDAKMTSEGDLLGTPAYMSPEQARGDVENVGPASDQYSLGVVLYELLTRQRPFDGPPAVVIAKAASEDEPPAPRTLDPGIPQDLEAICLKAMEKDPASRYSDSTTFAADLESWQRGESTLARPFTRVQRVARWFRKSPLTAGLTSAVALLLLVSAATGAGALLTVSRSTSALTSALKEVEAQTVRVATETRRADEAADSEQSATEAAREATKTAEEEAEIARKKREAMEAARLRLQEAVDRKTQAEKELAQLVQDRKAAEAKTATAQGNLAAASKSKKAVDDSAAKSRRKVYIERLEDARQALAKKDFPALSLLLEKCPEPERSWEYNFLKAVADSRSLTGHVWILFSVSKTPRRIGTGYAPVGLRNRYGVPVTVRSESFTGQSSDSVQVRMPDVDEDPVWVNAPPASVNAFPVSGSPVAVSPPGRTLATTSATDGDQFIQLWDIRSLAPEPIGSSKVPMKAAPARPKSRNAKASNSPPPEPAPVFAFSHDGQTLAQVSASARHFNPSPIRLLKLPAARSWEPWPLPPEGRDALKTSVNKQGSDLAALFRLFNENQSDAGSGLQLSNELSSGPDGRRIRLVAEPIGSRQPGVDGFVVPGSSTSLPPLEVTDGSGQAVASLDTGLDLASYFARWNLPPDAARYSLGLSGSQWSPDGERLIVHATVTCNYPWATDSRGGTRFDLWVPLITFDCVIIYAIN